MASVKIILYKSKTLKNGNHPIMLRVNKDRKRKYIGLGYNCNARDWDEESSSFKRAIPNAKKKNRVLLKELIRAEDILDEFLDEGVEFSLDDFRRRFVGIKSMNVFEYFDEVISILHDEGRHKTAASYLSTKVVFEKFTGKPLNFNELSYSYLKKFERYCRKKGNRDTTIAVYMKTFRALVNRAIKENKCKKKYYPFDDYKISDLDLTTAKRAISIDEILKIKDFAPKENTKQQLAKDLSLFSFYCMGMNFKDMALLKWENVHDERIKFKRSKTKTPFSIKILPPVQTILDFYKKYNDGSPYIFPILTSEHKTSRQISMRLDTGLSKYNKHLKVIGEAVGIGSLTSYVIRHSWATAMRRKGVGTSLISEMMGHSSEKVTRTYLDSFENEVIDSANELLL